MLCTVIWRKKQNSCGMLLQAVRKVTSALWTPRSWKEYKQKKKTWYRKCSSYLTDCVKRKWAWARGIRRRKNEWTLSSSSPGSVTGSGCGTPHSFSWCSGNQRERLMWFNAMRTGMNIGSLGGQYWWGVYRRRDHLICSLADWRTCRRKLGVTKQITLTTSVYQDWPMTRLVQREIYPLRRNLPNEQNDKWRASCFGCYSEK